MLYQSTCVGFGYGLCGGYFLEPLRGPRNPVTANNLWDSSPPTGPRILTWFPSTTPFGLALGTGSPCADSLYAGTPGLSATVSFTLFVVTRASIRTSEASRSPHGSPFAGKQNAPLPRKESEDSVHPKLRLVA